MVTNILATFVGSLIIFIVLVLVVSKERRRGRRFFAKRFRTWLDEIIRKAGDKVIRKINHFIRYIVQLNWYYSIHSILSTIMRMTVTTYDYVENIFERNRVKTKKLRGEKRKLEESNHLQQMADYKQDTMLTPAQQRKLKNRELEGK